MKADTSPNLPTQRFSPAGAGWRLPMLCLTFLMSYSYSALATMDVSTLSIGREAQGLKGVPEAWQAPLRGCQEALSPPWYQEHLAHCQKGMEDLTTQHERQLPQGSGTLIGVLEAQLWAVDKGLESPDLSPMVQGYLIRIGSLSAQFIERLYSQNTFSYGLNLSLSQRRARWGLGLGMHTNVRWGSLWQLYTHLGLVPLGPGVSTRVQGAQGGWSVTFLEAWVRLRPNRYLAISVGKLPHPHLLLSSLHQDRRWPFLGVDFDVTIYETQNFILKAGAVKEHFKEINPILNTAYNIEHTQVEVSAEWETRQALLNTLLKLNWFGDGQKVLPRSFLQNDADTSIEDMAEQNQKYRVINFIAHGQYTFDSFQEVSTGLWTQELYNTFPSHKPQVLNHGIFFTIKDFSFSSEIIKIEKGSIPPFLWPWYISNSGFHLTSIGKWSKIYTSENLKTSFLLGLTKKIKSNSKWFYGVELIFNKHQ